MKRYIIPPTIIYATIWVAGCAALTPKQTSQLIQVTGNVAVLAADYAADGKLDYAQAIPVALNSLAVYAPNAKVNTPEMQASIAATISDFTNGTGKTTGQKIAKAITDGLPAVITGAQAVSALTQASTLASDGVESVAGESVP